MSQAQQMVKHSTIYAIGIISRQLVGFIMLPIYTNYLTPEDYGVIGLLIFMVSLFEILLGAHMFQAVPKFYHQEEVAHRKKSVVATALIVTTIFSGIACLIMAYFSSPLSALLFGKQDYSIYIIIFSGLVLTHALEQYGLTYLRILKKPWTFFNFSMAKLSLQLGFNIITIIVLDWGLMGLALSSLISSVIISLSLISYTLYKTGFTFNRATAKALLIFSWPLWVSGFIGLYIGSSNRYFVRIFSSLDEVGLYELAAKFGVIVMVLVWNPFSQYWQTERFAIAKSNNPFPAYSLAFRIIMCLLIVSGIGINLFSGMIIEIMSAPLFHPAVDAIPFLVFASIFQSLTVFNNFSFMLKNKTFEITKNNAVTAIAITALYFLFIPTYGFVGASFAFALGSIIQYIYALNRGRLIYNLEIPQKSLIESITILAILTIIDRALVTQQFSFEIFFIKFVMILGSLILMSVRIFSKPEIRVFMSTLKKSKRKSSHLL